MLSGTDTYRYWIYWFYHQDHVGLYVYTSDAVPFERCICDDGNPASMIPMHQYRTSSCLNLIYTSPYPITAESSFQQYDYIQAFYSPLTHLQTPISTPTCPPPSKNSNLYSSSPPPPSQPAKPPSSLQAQVVSPVWQATQSAVSHRGVRDSSGLVMLRIRMYVLPSQLTSREY